MFKLSKQLIERIKLSITDKQLAFASAETTSGCFGCSGACASGCDSRCDGSCYGHTR